MAPQTPPEAPERPAAGGGGSGLQKRIGPFPAWVWLVGVGGVGLWMYRRRAAANAQPATDTLSAGAPLDTSGGSSGQISSPSSLASTQTLDQWRTNAFNALVAHGVSPALAEQALSNFLNENALGPLQSGAISKALGLVGPPPENLPFYGTVPSTGPTQKPPPVPTHDPGFGIAPIAAPPHVNMAPGEHIVDVIRSTLGGPSAGYYLTNLGGVYAVGGAPFLGSAFSRPHAAGTQFNAIEATPGGYILRATNGHTMAFAGRKAA